MANIETLGDGVTIYPDTMPPLLRKMVARSVSENPEFTTEEAILEAFEDMEYLVAAGKLALSEAFEAIDSQKNQSIS